MAPLFEVLRRIPERTCELQQAVGRLDAHALVVSAGRHGVSATLSDTFFEAKVDFRLFQRLLHDAQVTIASGQRSRRAALKLIGALGKAGIRPICLKGPVLGARLYPENPYARPATDLDVMVAPTEVERATAVLAGLGQKLVDEPPPSHEHPHHHLSFQGPLGLVELHLQLTRTFGGAQFDDAAVRSRAIDFPIDGLVPQILAPEDEFLYLATHAANHAFMRASWLCDLKRFLVLHPQLEWDVMRQRAISAGFFQVVSVALAVLKRTLDVPLSRDARRAFPQRTVRSRVDEVLFDPARVESAVLSDHKLASFALRLWLVDSVRHGARHVAEGALRYFRRAHS